MTTWVNSISLEGQTVNLVPLCHTHKDQILDAAADGKLWELWFTSVPSPKTIDEYVDVALDQKQDGKAMPYVVIDKQTGNIIGSTRYCNIEYQNKRLEIGYTWYAKSFQKTSVNKECKLLLLTHAFENLNCVAVEFRTHWHNMPSRQAIERLGAKQDGVLRNSVILPDGSIRDTVVYSILPHEWPNVKTSLLHRLEKYI